MLNEVTFTEAACAIETRERAAITKIVFIETPFL
jgi:hypothetical protein